MCISYLIYAGNGNFFLNILVTTFFGGYYGTQTVV